MRDILQKEDIHISPADCFAVCASDIANRQAHLELESYQQHKRFCFEHPIVIHWFTDQRLLEYYREQKKHAPEQLTQEAANLTQNIRRITSNIKLKKYKSTETLTTWQNNLQTAEMKLKIITKVISE